MKKSITVVAAVAMGGLFLAACSSNPQANRQLECGAGIIGGAAVGGLLGNQVGKGSGKDLATGVGAGAGAAVGTQLPACQ